MAQLCGKERGDVLLLQLIHFSPDSEASAILKRLTERLYRYNNWEHQADIDSLQDILSSPLFHTLYNLQESFAQLKAEYEKGNHLIRECRFDFDIHGRLQLLHRTDTNPSRLNRATSVSR